MEATSNLHVRLANALTAARLPVAVRNPRQIREFARSAGQLAKTDTLDARIIAHYAEAMRPPARPMPDTETQALQGLIARRRQLSAALIAERNHLRTAHAAAAADVRAHIDYLKRRMKDVERQIAQMIANRPRWRALDALLQSMPGVGPVVSMTLIASLPELGSADEKQIAALVGVAPLNRDSGLMRGRRTVWGGRVYVRTMLYLGANVARQHHPLLKDFYRRLRDAGKPHQVAVTACARKLVVMLNAMVRDEAPWARRGLAA
jgi:transposase